MTRTPSPLLCWAGLLEVEAGLPFAVESHPSAKSHVAKEMLRRLKEDVQYFANEVGRGKRVLTCMSFPGSAAVALYSSPTLFVQPVVARRKSG